MAIISPTKTKWQRAVNLIPNTENIKNRYFMLIKGDLFFIGDKSWFKVKDFMGSDVDMRLSFNTLTTAMSLPGVVAAEKVDSTRVRFTNGKQNLTVSYTQVEGQPQVRVPEDQEFYEIEPMYQASRNIFALATPGSVAGACEMEGQGHILLVTNRYMAGVIGKINFDMDMTANAHVIRTAISSQADVALGDKMMFFKLPGVDYSIYSAMKYSRPSISDKARAIALAMAKKEYEPAPDEEHVVISIKASEFADILPTVEKISLQGWMEATVTAGGMELSVDDVSGVEYRARIECESTSDCKFKSMVVTRPMLDFLSATQEPAKDQSIQLRVNLAKNFVIVRPVKQDQSAPDAYILMNIVQYTALQKQGGKD